VLTDSYGRDARDRVRIRVHGTEQTHDVEGSSLQTHTHDLTFTEDEVHKRFVSWEAGEADREWRCLTVLANHAPGLAPKPIRRETAEGRPVVVMERLHGDVLGREPLTEQQMVSLGQALRRLYDVPLAAAGAVGLTERRYDAAELPGTLRHWLADEYDLERCQEPGRVANALGVAREWLQAPDLPEPRVRALGIADLNPANVLWDGERCRLLDFEDGGLSEPAYELADHTEHLAARLAGVYDAATLADVVELTAEDRKRMHAYRSLWAAFWLVMLLPGNGGFHRNPAGTTEAQADHLLSLLQGP
jgi:aminoglycoside phosphotransferase